MLKTKLTYLALLCGFAIAAFAATPNDGSVLPFPPTPPASKAGPTLQESVHKRRVEPDRPPKDAPTRFHAKNGDGWFRVDLRSGWIARAEVLFVKPK